ncbi:hypothetical protein DCAR_0728209 [Daucus carota subsp. sativus]|uniref:Auxin-responsive protein n=1 Tax=Daucus carota subsp. sativus TaxID=79200 RepID=A0A164TAJ7_DAUCS|nr:hypothetical protein DCAR_0728209 [Daucus carota subsp. sativus]
MWRFRHQEEDCIPRDVPKGHLVVYVGKEYKRFVIRISLLENPLFMALLDQARKEYDFTATSSSGYPAMRMSFSVLFDVQSPGNIKMSY